MSAKKYLVIEITKISEGNPGAACALTEAFSTLIISKGEEPALLMMITAINQLYYLDIKGEDIYILYADICGKNILDFIVCLQKIIKLEPDALLYKERIEEIRKGDE